MNIALNKVNTDDGWLISGNNVKNLTSVKTSIDYSFV